MKKILPALLLVSCGAVFAQGHAQLDSKDRKFIEKAAAGGLLEVQAGTLAEQKAQSAGVKSFGSTLATDHAAANKELMALAQSKGVTVPGALPKKEQKKLDKVNKAKDFDRTFVKEQGLSDHKHDIKDFEKEAKDGKDPDVKAFAAKTLPTLQKHLQQAEQLEKELKASKG